MVFKTALYKQFTANRCNFTDSLCCAEFLGEYS